MTSDAAARRERAEVWLRWFDHRRPGGMFTGACASEVSEAYLAGAREEAEIKDAEIAAYSAQIAKLDKDYDEKCAELDARDAEIAALQEEVRDLEYANAMFTNENKSFREAIIGMEGGLNIADSWRTHPTVLYVLEGQP